MQRFENTVWQADCSKSVLNFTRGRIIIKISICAFNLLSHLSSPVSRKSKLVCSTKLTVSELNSVRGLFSFSESHSLSCRSLCFDLFISVFSLLALSAFALASSISQLNKCLQISELRKLKFNWNRFLIKNNLLVDPTASPWWRPSVRRTRPCKIPNSKQTVDWKVAEMFCIRQLVKDEATRARYNDTCLVENKLVFLINKIRRSVKIWGWRTLQRKTKCSIK